MDLRKVKKEDLYIVLDEIQKAYTEKFDSEIITDRDSETYGKYKSELCFVLNNSTAELMRLSFDLHIEFNKLHCGWKSVVIKELPEHYHDIIKLQLDAEIIAFYISTERLNNLPINDDLRLARFIVKNKNIILKLIKGYVETKDSEDKKL